MSTNKITTEMPALLPLMPLRDLVVFPHMIVPLLVGREKSVLALEAAMLGNRTLALSTQRHSQIDNPAEEDIYTVGTKAQILQVLKMPDNTIKALVEGQERIRIKAFHHSGKYLSVSYEAIPATGAVNPMIKALMRNNLELFEQYAHLNKKVPADIISALTPIDDPCHLVDIISANLLSKVEEKQKILETVDLPERLEALTKLLASEIEILEIERRIKGRVRKQMESTQKEYYLHEQIKAIRRELGQKDDENEVEELTQRIKKAKLSEEATEKALKELSRLDRMQAMSPEAAVIRTYIDWLITLPWSVRTKEKLDLKLVAKILDKDHYGLKKVKDRILEYLSVRKLAPEMKGPILCLVGPPGVGKTSLARSVARSLNRNFIRISLGGMRDEAEIRGHRRTYIGALPGRIIQSLKMAKSKNPLILLDEIDKIGSDFRGDPAAALLEVLDPEQNHSFNDHYLDVHFDLSEIMFIATANVIHHLHPTLRDRMEIIEISGYTQDEKIQIAERHLILRLLKEHGLTAQDLSVPRKIVEKIIMEYTSEAGVRNLNRELSAIMRKVARQKVEKRLTARMKNISLADLAKYLGPPKYLKRKGETDNAVGVATGLAWTEAGGEILSIEVTLMPGKGQLILTGKLGEVMRESAQAAMSYTRSHVRLLHLPENFYEKNDIHIHIPEGAIPKDGPSAGIAMATAIISALTGIAVRKTVAMTGEITLRGRVFAIGGLKEKLLAAMRADLKTVIIPKENFKDLMDVPAEVKKTLKIKLIEDMNQVIPIALVSMPHGRIPKEKLFPARGQQEKMVSKINHVCGPRNSSSRACPYLV